jgi:hypothetical protein
MKKIEEVTGGTETAGVVGAEAGRGIGAAVEAGTGHSTAAAVGAALGLFIAAAAEAGAGGAIAAAAGAGSMSVAAAGMSAAGSAAGEILKDFDRQLTLLVQQDMLAYAALKHAGMCM